MTLDERSRPEVIPKAALSVSRRCGQDSGPMSKGERDALAALARKRGRLARAEVPALNGEVPQAVGGEA